MNSDECEREWLSKYDMKTGRLKESLSIECGDWSLNNKDRTDKLIEDYFNSHPEDRPKELKEVVPLIKYNFECRSCGAIQTTEFKPKRCLCNTKTPEFILISVVFSDEANNLIEKFRDANLLNEIKSELSKDHIGDDNLKMTNFFCCVSGLSPNPKLRKSIANKANSSEGKDNLAKACLKHMPDDSYIFLTSATQATIEDDIKEKRIIAFSEVNSNREVGANKFLTEVIKQKAEGGTSSLKKDIRKGMKEARHDTGEQATIIYGTTETEGDEELGTRFIEGNIKTNYERIKAVNENTIDSFSDIDKLLQDCESKLSWIKIGLTAFYFNKDQYSIYIPYAKFLKEQINGQDIFDHGSPRSQRDLKRVFGLTCAVTYLFQLQRRVIEQNGIKILVSEPQDLINTLKYSAEFFNQSYSGLDARLNDVTRVMQELGDGWIARDDIAEKLEVSRNTIKTYCQTLADEGVIKGSNGKELNSIEGLKIYDSNKIYYKRCQKGVKKPLIRCQLLELKKFLEEKTKSDLTPFVIDDNNFLIDDKKVSIKKVSNLEIDKENGEKDDENGEKQATLSKIDTFNLTPLCVLCNSNEVMIKDCDSYYCAKCAESLDK